MELHIDVKLMLHRWRELLLQTSQHRPSLRSGRQRTRFAERSRPRRSRGTAHSTHHNKYLLRK
eukprot:9211449-Pyramimonas_sp.AAC.1